MPSLFSSAGTPPNLTGSPGDYSPRLTDWTDVAVPDHIVQFYETDASLIRSLAGFVAGGLDAGDRCLVIATSAHREALEAQLEQHGIDVGAARDLGEYPALDAAETLAEFMRDGAPDPDLFYATVGRLLESAPTDKRRIRAFGEMVGLLWSDGRRAEAIRLEELWNQLADAYSSSLLTVSDNGPGFPMDFDPAISANTGLDLIENIARVDLRGATSYRNGDNGGACVEIRFALGADAGLDVEPGSASCK
ncbi:MAG TPA: MEDS domain-containing protein [Chthonomonadaceae bacterium]|nr:MEDS domain-containing protein [Chthonomonadaceae bacterium]